MASRMDRYYKQNSVNNRSEKNKSLYRDIYETASYSNIEGIATIEKSNEIDITKVKNMLKNREEYQRQKDVRRLINKEVKPAPTYEELDLHEDKNYDIREILNNAKINKPKEEKYHRLENTNYGIFKKLNSNNKFNIDADNSENLHGLINTITNNSALSKLNDKDLSLDLLDDLKSDNNTVVDGTNSIKKLLAEAKKENQKEESPELDKTFFTSSLNFGEDDFEQLTNLNNNLKKNNVLMKILVFVVLLCVTAAVIVLIYNLIK